MSGGGWQLHARGRRRLVAFVGLGLALALVFAVAASAAPTNNTPPTVTGSSGSPFTSGETLTANTSASDWTYTAPISFTYQWKECASYASTVKASSPAGYWRLGEPSGAAKALDASGNAADGNYGGTVTLGQAGPLVGDPDTAAKFDGSTGFVEVPDASALDPASAFTLEAWVNAASLPGATEMIVTKPFTVGDRQSYSLGINSSGKAVATVVTTSNTYTATSSATVAGGGWHLLDATFSGTSLKVYVDGTASSATTAGTLQYSSLPLEIGRFDSTAGDYFDGTLDEVAVYGSALSATQIAANKTAALSPESESGSNCGNVPTGGTSSTYVPADADVGKQVYVEVTGTDGSGSTPADSTSQVILQGSGGPQPTAPSNTTPPDISGTAAVGQTLEASNGVWSGSTPITYSYQWQSCTGGTCTNISGATSQSYTVQSGDLGNVLQVVVTATNSAGSADATSAQTAAVVQAGGGAPVNSVLPSISGTAEVSQTLTASGGSWTGATPITLAYAWQLSTDGGTTWNPISGATTKTYVIPSGDLGDLIRVAVTATNNVSNSTAYSAATGQVVAGNAPSNTQLPTLSGNFAVGDTVTASPGSWSGSAPFMYSYQWQDCGAYNSTIETDAPAAYWRLDDDSGAPSAADSSGHGLAATYNGTVSYGEAGALTGDPDTAVGFDGRSAYLEVSDAAGIDPSGAVSLEAWVKTTATGGVIADKSFVAGSKKSYGLELSAGKAEAEVYLGTTSYTALGTGTIDNGAWHQVVATFDGANLKLYVDGQLQTTTTAAGSLQYNSALPLEIGRFDATAGQYFAGSLDEVAIYPSALNATQVGNHYHAGTDASGVAPCTDISGANDATYTLQSSDAGHKILVQVTADNPDGTSAPVSSASEFVGGSLPVNVSAPSLTGAAAVGDTVSADPGSWSGASPINYSYQWQECQAYAAAVMADSPIGYWRLNDLSGTTATDSSGNALNGTYSSTVTLGAAGDSTRCDASNAAAGFNGSNGYVSVPSSSQLILGSSFSVEAWFQGTGSNPSSLYDVVGRGTSYVNYNMVIDSNGHASFRANNSADGTLFDVTGSTVVTGGGWYHLVGTWDGHTASVYVNGVLDGSTSTSGTAYTAAGALDIGRFTGGGYFAKGTISDAAVYSSALSAAQVENHYQIGNGLYSNISGQTNSTYAPVTTDSGNRVRVQVTASNPAGSATAVSDSELVTSNGPTNDVIPTITGSAQVGETLTASTGVWSSPSSISYGYQWESAPSYEQSVMADSPLDYWRLDEPQGSTVALDLGSKGMNGGYGGGTGLQLGQPGALSGDPDTAVQFEGGEGYVWTPSGNPLPSSAFTLEGWFNTSAANSGLNPVVTFSHYNNCYGGGSGDCAYPEVLVETVNGKLEAHACDTTNSCITITGSTSETDGKWHMFDLERSGSSSWTLYLDGSQVGSTATGAGGALDDGSNFIEVGAAWNDDYTFSGLLDEIALYPTALAATDIAARDKVATTAPTFSAIAGATNPTYTVQSGDLGANLRVEVTATNASGSTPVDSLATGSVTGGSGPVNTALPKLSGSLAVGQTLVSDQGAWSGATPINHGYQWQRITSSFANEVLSLGPVGYWRLDEPSGTTVNDASGNGHTGSAPNYGYFGNVALGQVGALTGDPDTSIAFTDTSSYALVPDAPSLDTPHFTVEAWVRVLTNGSWQKIIGKGPNASEQWGLYIAPTTGDLVVQAELGTAQVSLDNGVHIGDNTWHYVAATWDGTNLTAYWSDSSGTIDSKSVTESGKTLKTNTEQISIGKEVSSSTNEYPLSAGVHQIDDVAVFSTVLTQQDIQNEYNAARTAPSIAPIAGATSSSYTLTANDEGASVRAQLTATNANGASTAYSLQTVPLGSNPPTLDLPNDGAASHTPDPVLSVDPVQGQNSVSYGFQVAADKGFTDIVADSGWLPSTTTWTVPTTANLSDGHTYYWHADALYNGVPTSWSSARSFRVLIKRFGTRSYWPIWSGDGVSVNETNGNLIAGAPGPSFPTEIGSMGVTLAYNVQDSTNNGLGAGWTLSGGAAPPTKLIDHAVIFQFDAVEIVWPDGSSDYYDHVGKSNTYRAPPGSGDQLTKNKDGTYTLLSADGYVYSFGVANGTTGIAHLTSAEDSSASVGKSVMSYSYNASDRLTSIVDSADPGRTVTLNWSCTGYLVCITGPDGKEWTYKGVSGGTGALATVNDGTRNLVTFTYGTSGNANGLIDKIQNANDLNPSQASAGYNVNHAVTFTYDADKRVTSVSGINISNQTPSSSTWQFTYHLSGPYATDATRADHADGLAGTVRQAAGYTTITDPDGHQSETYYDSADHPIETVDALGRITEAGWNANNEQIWSEDADGNPTDSTWDTVNNVLLSTQLPDSGNGRPTTSYRYDEKAVGTASSQGPSLQGLRGQYFPNVNIAGRATTDRNDPNVDFDWGSSGPDASVGTANFSVRFTGDLVVPSDGDYVFSTYSDSGTILVIDGIEAIDDWSNKTFSLSTQASQAIHLAAGDHLIELDYFEGPTAASHLHLLWSCATCSSPFGTQIVPASALAPGYEDQTSVVDPLGRIAFTHYASPAKAHPDYTLAQPGDGSKLITSFTYNSYGQVIQKVMPKGNLGRTINPDGSLSGGIDTTYATGYSYYAPGATATPPGTCTGGASADQGGQLQSESPHGLATISYVYDAAGDTVAKTNGRGTTCFTYDGERRLTSEIAPGDTKATTFTYDPLGNQLTESDASGTLSTSYDEANRTILSTDAWGAQASFTYDAAGDLLSRTTATGPIGSSPHYVTSYGYDNGNELVSETDPAGRQYQFFYDSRGNLHATQYPNGTFSWQDFNPDGWLSDLYNRHGTLSTPLPFSAPADSSPIADYSYQYNQAGQKTQEALAASGQADQVTDYSYDGLGRLAQAVLPDGTTRVYGYDADSNRTQVTDNGVTTATYTYDPSATPGVDELTSVGSTTYAYTSDGQVKSYGSNTVSWDGWGRISGGTFNGTTVTYHYDPSGALKSRTSSNGANTRYLLGDLFETDGAGTITTAYVDGPAGDLAQYSGPPAATSTLTYLYY